MMTNEDFAMEVAIWLAISPEEAQELWKIRGSTMETILHGGEKISNEP
jgi:hypothetical protein